jgi:Cu-processing system permease protein
VLFTNQGMYGFLVYNLSLFGEILIMSAFAIFASLILQSAVASVLGTFAFYFMARIMGFAVSSILMPAKLSHLNLNSFLESSLKGLSVLMPRLDQFSQSKWLIYGTVNSGTLNIILLQTAIYTPFIISMALLDFKNKEF